MAAACDADAAALVRPPEGARPGRAHGLAGLVGDAAAAGSGAWQPDQLGYGLTATTADPALPTYRAERFGGGALDWSAFDVAPPAAVEPTAPAAPAGPRAAHHPGDPGAGDLPRLAGRALLAARGCQHRLGAIDTFPTELGKLLLAEFTACFAGDWYRLPVRVPYGAAVHIEALVSTDTFGVQHLVPSAAAASGDRPWRMYEHSGDRRRHRPTAAGSWSLRCWPPAWTRRRSRRSSSSAMRPPTWSGASSTS